MESIRKEDPELPRRINSDIPGDLQDICLKALEKKPENRYRSAREMAGDLERFLAGEKVHANPTTYGSVVAAKIQEHLGEIEGWRHDKVLSDAEYEGFRKQYGRLIEREDAWILQARRLTFPQVSLYLGAWILIAGAALLFLFHFVRLSGTPRVLVATSVMVLTCWEGLALWRRNQLRNGIAHLLAVRLRLAPPLYPLVCVLAGSLGDGGNAVYGYAGPHGTDRLAEPRPQQVVFPPDSNRHSVSDVWIRGGAPELSQ
jgi:hypothetical protein